MDVDRCSDLVDFLRVFFKILDLLVIEFSIVSKQQLQGKSVTNVTFLLALVHHLPPIFTFKHGAQGIFLVNCKRSLQNRSFIVFQSGQHLIELEHSAAPV